MEASHTCKSWFVSRRDCQCGTVPRAKKPCRVWQWIPLNDDKAETSSWPTLTVNLHTRVDWLSEWVIVISKGKWIDSWLTSDHSYSVDDTTPHSLHCPCLLSREPNSARQNSLFSRRAPSDRVFISLRIYVHTYYISQDKIWTGSKKKHRKRPPWRPSERRDAKSE